ELDVRERSVAAAGPLQRASERGTNVNRGLRREVVELQKVDRGRFGCERVGKIAKVFDRPSPAQQPLIHRRVFTPQFGKGDAGVDVRINHSSIERNLVERASQMRE